MCFESVFMFFTTLDLFFFFMLQHVVYCLKINEYYDSRSVIMRIVYSLEF